MSFKRWLPTFVAFPVGGVLSGAVAGPLDGPRSAALGGLVAGVVIALAQAVALGLPRPEGRRWAVRTAGAMAAGATVAALANGAGTSTADLVAAGVITGAAVGAAQSTVLARGRAAAAAFTAVTAVSWGLGWLVTAGVIGDNVGERFHVFGSSGALLVTVAVGLALRRLLAAPAERSVLAGTTAGA